MPAFVAETTADASEELTEARVEAEATPSADCVLRAATNWLLSEVTVEASAVESTLPAFVAERIAEASEELTEASVEA